jgi:AcrR family transcriptional regulator
VIVPLGVTGLALEMSAGDRERPLRVDAERNRRRLLDAAAEAFAEQGLEVSIDEIARRAGVGKGTVFRRFPTKEHLVAAVISDRLGELLDRCEALLEADDPGPAVHEFLSVCAQAQARDRGLFEAVGEVALADPDVRAGKARLIELAGRLLDRAQAAGAVRDDVTAADLVFLLGGISYAAAPLLPIAPGIWRRYVDVVFDGLRPEGAHQLSGRAPTKAQVDRAFEAKVEAARGANADRRTA